MTSLRQLTSPYLLKHNRESFSRRWSSYLLSVYCFKKSMDIFLSKNCLGGSGPKVWTNNWTGTPSAHHILAAPGWPSEAISSYGKVYLKALSSIIVEEDLHGVHLYCQSQTEPWPSLLRSLHPEDSSRPEDREDTLRPASDAKN
jgi:hypothetical protein